MCDLTILGKDPDSYDERDSYSRWLIQCPNCNTVRSVLYQTMKSIQQRGHSLCHACSVHRARFKPIENIPGRIIIIEQLVETRGDAMNGYALVKCPDCGKQFTKSRTDTRNRGSTVCLPCARARKCGPAHQNWRGGRHRQTSKQWQQLADFVRERDNYTCQRCGYSRDYDLHVHHILPYRDSLDNSEHNLITLCRSCHSWADMNLDQSVPMFDQIISAIYNGF